MRGRVYTSSTNKINRPLIKHISSWTDDKVVEVKGEQARKRCKVENTIYTAGGGPIIQYDDGAFGDIKMRRSERRR